MARTKKNYDTVTEENARNDEVLSSAEVKTPGPETKNGIIVNCIYVNVRKDPSILAESIKRLRSGSSVEIHKKVYDFYKVSSKDVPEGYIHSKFVKEE